MACLSGQKGSIFFMERLDFIYVYKAFFFYPALRLTRIELLLNNIITY